MGSFHSGGSRPTSRRAGFGWPPLFETHADHEEDLAMAERADNCVLLLQGDRSRSRPEVRVARLLSVPELVTVPTRPESVPPLPPRPNGGGDRDDDDRCADAVDVCVRSAAGAYESALLAHETFAVAIRAVKAVGIGTVGAALVWLALVELLSWAT